jgi:hypothetical protein
MKKKRKTATRKEKRETRELNLGQAHNSLGYAARRPSAAAGGV